MSDVDKFIDGVAGVPESILKMAGDIQSRGISAEQLGSEPSFTHAECAFIVRSLQAFSGLFAETIALVENQNAEIRLSRIKFPDEAKPKLIMQ